MFAGWYDSDVGVCGSNVSGSDAGDGFNSNMSNMWYCDICNYYNPDTTAKCISCSVDKDDDAWDILDFDDFKSL